MKAARAGRTMAEKRILRLVVEDLRRVFGLVLVG